MIIKETILEDGTTKREYSDGFCSYWKNGERHRVDGPAIIHADGSHLYFINGKLHRLDGPAIDTVNCKEWWYQNTKINCFSQKEYERRLRLKAFW